MNFDNESHYFAIISTWKRADPSIWINFNPLQPMMHCAKFGWNWPSASGEEDFYISSMYFRYFAIISSWKRAGPFIWTNLNPLYPRMLCAKFGWNWTVGSGGLKFGVAYHLKGPAGPNIMQGKVRHVFKKNESEAEQSFGYIKIKMYLNNTSRNVGWERLRIPHTQFYFVESVLPSLSI